MAIISESNPRRQRTHGNTQFRNAMVYVLVTFVVLLFLNVYTSGTSQKVFYQNKQSSMLEKCQLAASEISALEVLNESSVAAAVEKIGSLRISRLIVTDQKGVAVYDSLTEASAQGFYTLLPEIIHALDMNDVFTWTYHDGAMLSKAAVPVVSNGTLVGCVYIMEYDTNQGTLIKSLQDNILTITLVLELVIIIVSLSFSRTFSGRIRKILGSIRTIREGDYSHKVKMGGNDELTFLGEEFNDLTDKLQASENKRRQFVSDASHELKTPLASIKLLSDSILQNDVDMETVREFVGDIGNEADRLNRMSQKLLSLTHIESQQDGDCEIVPLVPTVERVVRMLSGIAEESGVTIELDLQQDSTILMLEDDLYQITFNLVENGIKYNVAGGTLTVRLMRQDENAILQVIDTGVGIPEDAVGHLFERFYRVDKARSRKSGGSGLGLAIVKNMVERNEGTIQVESTVGKGSTFTVTFPIFDTEEDAQ